VEGTVREVKRRVRVVASKSSRGLVFLAHAVYCLYGLPPNQCVLYKAGSRASSKLKRVGNFCVYSAIKVKRRHGHSIKQSAVSDPW